MKKFRPNMTFVDNRKFSDINQKFSSVSSGNNKPRILLHACCGPCSTSCIEKLVKDFSVTVFYYNPNITDREEYLLRRSSLIQFLDMYNEEHKDEFTVNYLEGAYDLDKFLLKAEPLNNEPEGGKRCDICFGMRLKETAKKAKSLEMDYFTTTMSVSPHKNYEKIKTLGIILQESIGIKFLDIDFKKNNGFSRSVEMSKEYGLYRQKFCGCEFAREAMKNE